MMKSKHNKSAYFLLPLLEIPFMEFNQANDGFINSYAVNTRPIIGIDKILCVLLDRKKIDFDAFDQCIKNECLITRYISADYFVFVYNFPEPYKKEWHNFWEGKYSMYTETAKAIITYYIKKEVKDLNTGKTIENKNYRALYPNEESRRTLAILLGVPREYIGEVIARPERNNELLDIDTMLNNGIFNELR